MKRGRKNLKIDFIPKMKMDHAHAALGDFMPEIHATEIGKHRLHTALKNRFGENYKNIPQVKAAIHEFDEQRNYYKTLAAVQLKRKK